MAEAAARESHCTRLEIAIYSRIVNATKPLVRRVELPLIALTACLWAGCQSTDSGVRSDKDLDHLRARAESGNAQAQYELGQIYATGDGVPRNDELALKWLRPAATQGHTGAQYNLGLMYKDGRGTERNFVEAYKWLNLSAARGNPNAEVRLDTVSRLMNREQIAEAQRAALNFKVEKPVAKAAAQPVKKPAEQPVEKPTRKADRKVAKEPVFAPFPLPGETMTNHEPLAVTQPAPKKLTVEKTLPAMESPPVEKPAEKTAKKSSGRKPKPEPVYGPVPPPSGQ